MVEFLMIVRLLCLAKHCGRKLIENYSRVLWSKDHGTFLCKGIVRFKFYILIAENFSKVFYIVRTYLC